MTAAVHTATLTLSPNDGWPGVKLTCHAGPDGKCRQTCAEHCEDESYEMTRDEDGSWWHARETWPGEPAEALALRHAMKDSGECLTLLWLDETGAAECYEGPDDQALNDTPITVRWDGDGYVWQPAEDTAVQA